LAALVPNLDINSLKTAPGTIPVIDLQLEWHRTFDSHVPKKSTKALKIEALIAAAVEHVNNGEMVIHSSPNTENLEDDVMEIDNMDTEDEMEHEDMNMN
jgi:hypothetical protein